VAGSARIPRAPDRARDGLGHAFRLGQGRRGVVQVDE
jgi:hypothetical protein